MTEPAKNKLLEVWLNKTPGFDLCFPNLSAKADGDVPEYGI